METIILTHITFNTGDIASVSRDNAGQPAVDLLRALLGPGERPIPPMPNWLLWTARDDRLGCAVFRLRMIDVMDPSVLGAVCWDEANSSLIWDEFCLLMNKDRMALERISFWKDASTRPPPVPWLVVGLTPFIVLASATDLLALGDLEQCLAWSLIEVTN